MEIFEDVFNHILKLCILNGLVDGKIQSIDTAYINANASIDRLVEVKMIDRDPKDYLDEVMEQDSNKEVYGHDDEQMAKKKMEKSQKTLERYKNYRQEKYTEQDGGKTQRKNKRRFLSNATHMSSTDSDARIAKKSGNPRMLCYSSMMSVDTANHVITHMSVKRAHKEDSRYLIKTVKKTADRLKMLGCLMTTVLADTGFSSGENYASLNAMNIESYIPVHGGYKPIRDGFDYDSSSDSYTCSEGQSLEFVHIGKAGGYYKKRYYSKKKICDKCPKKIGYVGRRGFKQIAHTIYRNEYDAMIEQLKSEKGKATYGLRMHTVEPVFGTLQQHYGLRWINTRGIDLANKVMLMAACAINLRKLVKNRIDKHLLVLFDILSFHKPSQKLFFNRVVHTFHRV